MCPRRRREAIISAPPAVKASAAVPISAPMPVAPVNGNTDGVRVTFSPSTVVGGTSVGGLRVWCSDSTSEQKLLASVGVQAGGGVPQSSVAVSQSPPPQSSVAVSQSPPPQSSVAVSQSPPPQSSVAVSQSPPPQSSVAVSQSPPPQSSAVASQPPPPPQSCVASSRSGGVALQPVCAGLVRPMPWLRSHS